MGLVQDFDDHFGLVHEAVVSELLAHAFEDLGEGPSAEALRLRKVTTKDNKLERHLRDR